MTKILLSALLAALAVPAFASGSEKPWLEGFLAGADPAKVYLRERCQPGHEDPCRAIAINESQTPTQRISSEQLIKLMDKGYELKQLGANQTLTLSHAIKFAQPQDATHYAAMIGATMYPNNKTYVDAFQADHPTLPGAVVTRVWRQMAGQRPGCMEQLLAVPGGAMFHRWKCTDNARADLEWKQIPGWQVDKHITRLLALSEDSPTQ